MGWTVLYVGGIALSDVLFRQFSAALGVSKGAWLCFVVIVPAIVAGSYVVLAKVSGSGRCTWLPEGMADWIVFGLASIGAGLFLYPLLSTSDGIWLGFRALGGIFLLSLLSLQVLHLSTGCGTDPARRSLGRSLAVGVSRLPLFVLIALLLLGFVVALAEILGRVTE